MRQTTTTTRMTLTTSARSVRREWWGAPFPAPSASIEGDRAEGNDSEQGIASSTTPRNEDECPVDKYQVFKEVMRGIQKADPLWFVALTSGPQFLVQQRSPQKVNVLTGHRKAAAESIRIEKSGGYVFQNQTAPSSFSSGGTRFVKPQNFEREGFHDLGWP
ncbi:importin-7-like [Amblyomma americanum]